MQYLGPNVIEVRQGKSRSVTCAGESRDVDMKDVRLPDTVEQRFDVARVSGGRAAVAYDPTFGYLAGTHTVRPGASHDNFTIHTVRDFERKD